MDWDDLKYFIELARTGTLTVTARRLGVQHSTVARRIARLEREQGRPLFVRDPDGYHLNRAGKSLLVQAEEISAAFDRLRPNRGPQTDQLSGVVRIGCTEGFGTYLFAPCLARLRAAYPEIVIDLLVKQRPVHLSRNEADIVINVDRPGRGPYLLSKLLEYKLGLFASSQYLATHPAPSCTAELHEHHFISYMAEMEPAKDLATIEAVPYTRPAQIRSTSLLAQKAAVLAGCGIAVLPHYMAAGEPDLHPLLADQIVFRKAYYMSIAEETRYVPWIAAVWKFLKADFSVLSRQMQTGSVEVR
ncbi:LysR family transcriptional regulator [Microvirga sp. VF16]|uniref:LysR family transcriptional regulator n=1 Tax=Microvirga sp. VF16 TaxID=2807101 RepID=UPI00193DC65C|nr:LysR family transcriptional regulator [Microvirga sp. VF16]QRM32905.1 LysR family transcriptional regulator [Microvirga sp. VF16]